MPSASCSTELDFSPPIIDRAQVGIGPGRTAEKVNVRDFEMLKQKGCTFCDYELEHVPAIRCVRARRPDSLCQTTTSTV